jgi:hypothetical protein
MYRTLSAYARRWWLSGTIIVGLLTIALMSTPITTVVSQYSYIYNQFLPQVVKALP